MLCNMCNERNAIFLVQQVTVGGKKEIHLCTQCAKDKGIDISESNVGLSIENLISSMSVTKSACYVCGKTLDEIKKTGLVGCPECYAVFNSEIKEHLQKMGLEIPYIGSMPKKLEHFRSILTDRIEIQKKLDNSIASEDYEKAAMYRDFLSTLERSSVSSSEDEGDYFDK